MNLKEKVKRIQELRRSNASQPIRNKKKYTRKIKYKKAELVNQNKRSRRPQIGAGAACDLRHMQKMP